MQTIHQARQARCILDIKHRAAARRYWMCCHHVRTAAESTLHVYNALYHDSAVCNLGLPIAQASTQPD